MASDPSKKVTTRTILELKSRGEPIAALTAYDFLTARLLDAAGIDILLVGDSLANVVQGHDTTLPVTLDEMIYHSKAVMRGVERAMVVVDLPFMSYQVNAEEGFRNAGRIMKETGANAVKLEGGRRVADGVGRMVEAGIPVMGHLGLTPQSIQQFGGYRPRGASPDEAKAILSDAKVLEEAGVFAIVLEKIPAALAKEVSASISVPTIGIGAGAGCDGQILVTPDMLGMNEEFHPRFVRLYARLADSIRDAARTYKADVKARTFPTEEESY
jgi:3-methyl-2-oxobutanoate hydroxymethyltransferase